ncbi:MAG TPA: Cof-type HAD-IIB family hydrolase [Ktedonobacterales bacterium]|nr:Cof-type HAD-IIB family hydrolase [Ktedonobacterales bacterium]
MYRLVALDVDGTLLNSAHELTPRVRRAVQATRARGVIISLATGKLLRSVQSLIDELGIYGPHITCNGAVIAEARRSTGRNADQPDLRWSQPLSPSETRQALTALRRHAPDLGIAWYTADTIYTDAPTGPLDAILRAYHEPPIRHVAALDPQRVQLPPAVKLLVTGSHERLARLRAALAPELAETLEVIGTTPDFLECMSRSVSKGAALRRLMEQLSVARDDTLAIGDGENDISLIEAAGMGIAMGNAVPALTQRARLLTASNDNDGVALALERFIAENQRIGPGD